MKKILILIAGIGLSLSPVLAGSPAIGAAAPDFELTDSQGNTHKLSAFKGKFVVLEWVNYGCPFVKKHYQSDNMQTLQKKYGDKGVVWLSICSSAEGKQGHFTGDELASQIKANRGQQTAYLIDADGKVGKTYGARTTPHMFVINPDGDLIYKGAIDDRASTSTSDVEGATNYVAQALDEAMAGKPVSQSATQPYGCSVKY